MPSRRSSAPRLWAALVLAPWRLLRIGLHIAKGLWLTRVPHTARPPEVQHEIVRHWSRQLLHILGIDVRVHGSHPLRGSLLVANHVSWLDIMALNAVIPSRFVSKAEVAGWPVVGRMVTSAGTLYLRRERPRDAARVLGVMASALKAGDTVAVFPEGTTGDARAVLRFHANLLQAAIDAQVPVQPVALRYTEPGHSISPSVLFVGDTTLLQSLWNVVTARRVVAHVHILPPQPAGEADRRTLSALLHRQISEHLRSIG